MIGEYKLMEQIGEDGMGLVFVAEQQQPVRRKVALKVIKPGMDTLQVIARFEAERQALALMDHPNIAKVYDGGATPSGRLYFVMELVKGVAITDYCDQNQIPVRERLELFLHVCQAVQHAHQKGCSCTFALADPDAAAVAEAGRGDDAAVDSEDRHWFRGYDQLRYAFTGRG
jgi:serine/threonine protein kinase